MSTVGTLTPQEMAQEMASLREENAALRKNMEQLSKDMDDVRKRNENLWILNAKLKKEGDDAKQAIKIQSNDYKRVLSEKIRQIKQLEVEKANFQQRLSDLDNPQQRATELEESQRTNGALVALFEALQAGKRIESY